MRWGEVGETGRFVWKLFRINPSVINWHGLECRSITLKYECCSLVTGLLDHHCCSLFDQKTRNQVKCRLASVDHNHLVWLDFDTTRGPEKISYSRPQFQNTNRVTVLGQVGTGEGEIMQQSSSPGFGRK